jgi:glycosyltransferase involved in cell wall biosynthesis
MNLGFHYHIPAAKIDGKIVVPGYLGVFLDSLAERVSFLHLFMHHPLDRELPLLDYEIKSNNVVLYDLGLHDMMLTRWLVQRQRISPYKNIIKSLDAFLVRVPTPMLNYFANILPKQKLFLLKVGDYGEAYKSMVAPLWKRSIMAVWIPIYQYQEKNVIKKACALFSNSQVFIDRFDKVKNRKLIRTTTLSEDSFYQRQFFNSSGPINLLYTGRLELGKGLLEMVDVLSLLIKDNIDAILNFVGWEDKPSEPVKAKLLDRAKELGIEEKVLFHGKKRLGPELLSSYRSANIYILASKAAEGFPRTLWEAMASSLPIVATKIGAIPYVLQDKENALLVQPNDVPSLFAAVKELIVNNELRNKIVHNAYLLAKDNTLEKQAELLVKSIEEYQGSSKKN